MASSTGLLTAGLALGAATLAPAGAAGPDLFAPPTIVVLEGDVVPGVGAVTSIANIAVVGPGEWVVEADTDNPDTDADTVILTDEGLAIREGEPVPAIAGASIDGFDAIAVGSNAEVAANLFLDGPPSGMDSGVFLGDFELLIQEGDFSTAARFAPGTTPYLGWFDVKVNGSNQILMTASIDDPTVASSVDRALIVLEYDPGLGTVLFEQARFVEGDILPGQTEPVSDFGTGTHESAINDDGEILFVADLAGDTSVDMAIYLNNTLIAQEGGLSPDGVRTYELLTRGVHMNNIGEIVFRANLSGSSANDEVIIRDDAIVMSEGDFLASLGATVTGFGSSGAPLTIADSGDIFWFAQFAGGSALMVDGEPLLRTGDMVDGLVIQSFSTIGEGFHVFPDGSAVIVRAQVGPGSDDAAILIQLESPCACDWNEDTFLNDTDFFDWVNDFFGGSGPQGQSDFNADGFENAQDWFDFVNCFFGPPDACG